MLSKIISMRPSFSNFIPCLISLVRVLAMQHITASECQSTSILHLSTEDVTLALGKIKYLATSHVLSSKKRNERVNEFHSFCSVVTAQRVHSLVGAVCATFSMDTSDVKIINEV